MQKARTAAPWNRFSRALYRSLYNKGELGEANFDPKMGCRSDNRKSFCFPFVIKPLTRSGGSLF